MNNGHRSRGYERHRNCTTSARASERYQTFGQFRRAVSRIWRKTNRGVIFLLYAWWYCSWWWMCIGWTTFQYPLMSQGCTISSSYIEHNKPKSRYSGSILASLSQQQRRQQLVGVVLLAAPPSFFMQRTFTKEYNPVPITPYPYTSGTVLFDTSHIDPYSSSPPQGEESSNQKKKGEAFISPDRNEQGDLLQDDIVRRFSRAKDRTMSSVSKKKNPSNPATAATSKAIGGPSKHPATQDASTAINKSTTSRNTTGAAIKTTSDQNYKSYHRTTKRSQSQYTSSNGNNLTVTKRNVDMGSNRSKSNNNNSSIIQNQLISSSTQPTARTMVDSSSRRNHTSTGKKMDTKGDNQKSNPQKKTILSNGSTTTDIMTAVRDKNPSKKTVQEDGLAILGNNRPTGTGSSTSVPRQQGPVSKQRTSARQQQQQQPPMTYSSLLPPPLPDTFEEDDDDPLLSSGLSSWEEFLGVNREMNNKTSYQLDRFVAPLSSGSNVVVPPILETDELKMESRSQNTIPLDVSGSQPNITDLDPTDPLRRVPSVQELFPPDLSVDLDSLLNPSIAKERPASVLDGVLPVSDLFYRSSATSASTLPDHDDEELPFSAEQSDALSSDNNMVRIRRNLASQKWRENNDPATKSRSASRTSSSGSNSNVSTGKVDMSMASATRGSQRSSRRLVRRGMDLLVGGIPIHADPPQRSLELFYDNSVHTTIDWASVISLNSKDFGPLVHTASIPKVSNIERGLYCEYFSHAALKWDICPKDLRQIIRDYSLSQVTNPDQISGTTMRGMWGRSLNNKAYTSGNATVAKDEISSLPRDSMQGIASSGRASSMRNKREPPSPPSDVFVSDGECFFEIGLSRDEIETAPDVFRDVVMRSFRRLMEKATDRAKRTASVSLSNTEAFQVDIPVFQLKEGDDGSTGIKLAFRVVLWSQAGRTNADRRLNEIKAALDSAIEDGQFEFALAATAKEETRWPPGLGERVIEECMIDDDVDEELVYAQYSWETPSEEVALNVKQEASSPLILGEAMASPESLFAGGGNEGVFRDFSEANALASPYGGQIGLRLVEAVIERAKQRQPRVIAIGDVHGCIDELQDLLRECDYRPGDLVVFLGDLVCKGPDSISVVQMAREIGAIGVRGNHDFEVIRWHQAIKSGVDTPVVGSEHFHIASCLSKADINWMHSLPWYISSKDLACLFVHAGFVSGIRLSKQNPRLMMNMRSILPDGTVTSKFFNQWPWARLWDGPQTVLFGHDADRGLQQYEHAIGLDTGCVYGGRLTACILPEKRLVSVSARREYFKYRRRHYD